MVKADAYGCGLSVVLPALEGRVDAFGVASLEEAQTLRALGSRGECILFEGVFDKEELRVASDLRLQCVLHHIPQLRWLLATPLKSPMKMWVKVNTGMNRLGFSLSEVDAVMASLRQCPWVDPDIGVMTHFACADAPEQTTSIEQLARFNTLSLPISCVRSLSNSAAILNSPEAHGDAVRPGIMLYGVSPFASQTGLELGLKPVMRLVSAIMTVRDCPVGSKLGYGAAWTARRPTVMGVVPIGYGDGYPRHVGISTPAWVHDTIVPVVGTVSMDMLTLDLTDCPDAREGDPVELWGVHVPVETIAAITGRFSYELLTQVTSRVRV
jgi:alanine racemase